ncbi:SH3 domain-containing protein [Hoeflea ulvae]|uniref:SH3 domain-containing protein n=1 Tax=Hoeflea ulvae TaxID=2983764 RepID=A0ABT3YDT2_9HYPH|nr:SH3 domain-containing protein [Hoeflea ulvae]MCY0094045.1 SH3 domain-containing protein [Hoeflea ulvae]
MKQHASLAAMVGLLVVLTGSAFAQSSEEFVKAFSGEWYVFDPDFRNGDQPCQISLETEASGDRYVAAVKNCDAALASVATWGILENQLGLFAGDGTPFAKLGGNQLRVTGETLSSNIGLIFERAQGDGNNAQISAALRTYGCFFDGFSNQCTSKADLGKPALATDAAPEVKVIVNLNIRSQPRRNAQSIGVVSKDTCVKINQCLSASDGVWCSAQFGDKTGWLSKTALRQDKWPVITFRNSCSKDG